MYLDLEKLDEAAAMLFLTSSGILSKNHVFYQQIHSFCTSAMGLVDELVLPSMYPALFQFKHAIQFNCKPVASYLLSGRGKHGLCRNYLCRNYCFGVFAFSPRCWTCELDLWILNNLHMMKYGT